MRALRAHLLQLRGPGLPPVRRSGVSAGPCGRAGLMGPCDSSKCFRQPELFLKAPGPLLRQSSPHSLPTPPRCGLSAPLVLRCSRALS